MQKMKNKKSVLILSSLIIIFLVIFLILFLRGSYFKKVAQSGQNASEKVGTEMEQLLQETEQIADKSMVREESSEKIGEENSATESQPQNAESDLSSFYGYDLPLAFDVNHTEEGNENFVFDVSDEDGYYLLKGSLICGECVDSDIIDSAETGQHFVTGSGRGYTISSRETYNNDEREKIVLLGDDGQMYEIVNIPAFVLDTYTGTPYYVITTEDGKNYQTVFTNMELRIPYDTKFPDGVTFDDCVKQGLFEDVSWNIWYDIHFTEDGTIDVLTAGDVNSNGPWGGEQTERWEVDLE